MPSVVGTAPSSSSWVGGALQHFAKQKEAPPEIVHQYPPYRLSVPVAPPGSHSAVLRERQGLKMSPPSKTATTAQPFTSPSAAPCLPLSKGPGKNQPEMHLWSAPLQGRRKNAAASASTVGGGGSGGNKHPLRSPMHRVEWWRRPPSPLVSHMRPLWESTSGSAFSSAQDISGVFDGTNERVSRAPEDSVEEASGLLSTVFSQPAPAEKSPAASPAPSSAFSQDSTFFTRKPIGEPRHGGWSLSAIADAPPPPAMAAPTSATAAMGRAANASGVESQARSPSGSPESTRPRASEEMGNGGAPPPPYSPPRPPKGPSGQGAVAVAAAAAAAAAVVSMKTPARHASHGKQGSSQHPSPAPTVAPSPADSLDGVVSGGGSEVVEGSRRSVRRGGAGRGGSRPASPSGRPPPSLLARRRSLELKLNRDLSSAASVEDSLVMTSIAQSASTGEVDVTTPESTASSAPVDRAFSTIPPAPAPQSNGPGSKGGREQSDDPVRGGARLPVTSRRQVGRAAPEDDEDGKAWASATSPQSGATGGSAAAIFGSGAGGAPAAVVLSTRMSRVGNFEKTVSTGLKVAIAEMERLESQHGGEHGPAAGNDGGDDASGGGVSRADSASYKARTEVLTGEKGGRSEEGRSAAQGGSGATRGGGDEETSKEPGGTIPRRGPQLSLAFLSEGSSAFTSDNFAAASPASLSLSTPASIPLMAAAAVAGAAAAATVVTGTDAAVAPTAAAVTAPENPPLPIAVGTRSVSASTMNASSDGESESSDYSTSSCFTATSVSTTATGMSGATGVSVSTYGDTLSVVTGSEAPTGPSPSSSMASSSFTTTSRPAPGGGAQRPPSPASSLASSSLRTSMRTRSRARRRSDNYSGKGTRPEREVGGSGRLSSGGVQQLNRRSTSRRRSSPPSAESPLSVGGGVRAPRRRLKSGSSSGSIPRSRMERSGGGGGIVQPRLGSGRVGVAGIGGSVSGGGGTGAGIGSAGSSGRSLGSGPLMGGGGGMGLDGKELRHMTATGYDDDGEERHYVNPMNASSRVSSARQVGGTPVGVGDEGMETGASKGAFSKLLRRFSVLRRRWRQNRQKKESNAGVGARGGGAGSDTTSEGDDMLEFITSRGAQSNGIERKVGVGSGGGGVNGAESGADLDAGAGAGSEQGVPSNEELEMACRHLLDALWMSAKRGSDTIPISVSDGRMLLTGLVAARGEGKHGIDLGMPLPRATAATASGVKKTLRPVLGGASGPFARAANQNSDDDSGGGGGGGGGRGKRARKAAALKRAMELAMGVTSEGRSSRNSRHGTSANLSGDHRHENDDVGYRPVPSASRHQGRNALSRAHLHDELRNASAAVGLLNLGRDEQGVAGIAAGGGNGGGSSAAAAATATVSVPAASDGSHRRHESKERNSEGRAGVAASSSPARPSSSRSSRPSRSAPRIGDGGGGGGLGGDGSYRRAKRRSTKGVAGSSYRRQGSGGNRCPERRQSRGGINGAQQDEEGTGRR